MHYIEDNEYFIIKKCDVPIVRETMERANIEFNETYETKVWDIDIIGLENINSDNLDNFRKLLIHNVLYFWDNMTYYKRKGGIDVINFCNEKIGFDHKYPKSLIVTQPVAEKIIDDCKNRGFPYRIKYSVVIDGVNMVCLEIEHTDESPHTIDFRFCYMADITDPLRIEI